MTPVCNKQALRLSGMWAVAQGHIVTNYHVVKDASQLQVCSRAAPDMCAPGPLA